MARVRAIRESDTRKIVSAARRQGGGPERIQAYKARGIQFRLNTFATVRHASRFFACRENPCADKELVVGACRALLSCPPSSGKLSPPRLFRLRHFCTSADACAALSPHRSPCRSATISSSQRVSSSGLSSDEDGSGCARTGMRSLARDAAHLALDREILCDATDRHTQKRSADGQMLILARRPMRSAVHALANLLPSRQAEPTLCAHFLAHRSVIFGVITSMPKLRAAGQKSRAVCITR